MNILVEMSMAFQVYEHLVECVYFSIQNYDDFLLYDTTVI